MALTTFKLMKRKGDCRKIQVRLQSYTRTHRHTLTTNQNQMNKQWSPLFGLLPEITGTERTRSSSQEKPVPQSKALKSKLTHRSLNRLSEASNEGFSQQGHGLGHEELEKKQTPIKLMAITL